MQSSRAGCPDTFLKEWGALAGTFTVEPAVALAAECQLDLAVQDREHLLEVVTVRGWAAAGGSRACR